MARREEKYYHRILFVFGIFSLIFLILGIRLGKIQLWDHYKLSVSASRQRRSVILNNKLRGEFLDRHGKVLRGSRNHWYLMIQNKLFDPENLPKLSPVLATDFSNSFQKHSHSPLWIYPKALNLWQIQQIDQLNLQGIRIVADIPQSDGLNNVAWHLLGLVQRGQGLSGLEYLYDSVIQKHSTQATVFTVNDGLHRYIPGLGFRSQSRSNKTSVILTLDLGIQQTVEKVMDQEDVKGAVVILDAESGDILAMASRPTVNLHNLMESITSADNPFINRAVSAYHPGSIFKLVILAAALDSGQLNPFAVFSDPGYFQSGDIKWYCTTSNKSGHGSLTLSEALAYSCNPVFIEIAVKLRPALVLDYADSFGLGQPCNIGLRDESWGELPSEVDLSIGDQVNTALGEGNVYTTPLQVASLVQTIVNDGIRKIPRLVSGYSTPNGARWFETAAPIRVIQSRTARIIKVMMADVIRFGTGKQAGVTGGAGGKTGTAQSGTADNYIEHAWFAGFAPEENPKYVAVVFCEQGVSGGKTAAPIFKGIMEQVIKINDLNQRPE